MKKLLNTLYITTENNYLHRDGDTIVVQSQEGNKVRFPIHNLESIICFGPVSISSPLMQLCGERGVYITLLSQYGKYYSRIEGPISGNVLLRRKQFKLVDDEIISLNTSKSIIIAKVMNSRNILLRALRDCKDYNQNQVVEIQKTIDYMYFLIHKIETSSSFDTVRGIEGEAARKYFEVFNNLILSQKEDFVFCSRNRRPPLDNVNAMLSFVYTLLAHDTCAALQSVGLDPAVGFFHVERPGRPSLALDLMEEFRAYLGDRLVLSLINRKQVKGKGFIKTESGSIQMDNTTRKTLIEAYQKRKQEEIEHPFIKEKIKIGLIPYVQSQLMARFIRGDLEAYPPFFVR